jgi:hypothetical protein
MDHHTNTPFLSPQPARGAPADAFSAAALAALRCGLRAQLAGAPASDAGDLRRAIRLLCADAHRRGLRAEQLIVLLKQAWAALPEVQGLPQGRQGNEALAGIVSLCIDEFYAARE